MSINQDEIEEIDNAGGGGITDSRITPTIKDAEGRQVKPVYTEKLRGRTKNDNLVHKSLCGETEVEPVGEEEWHMNIEGIVTREQLQTMFEMRPAGNELTIIGEARVHRDINFDSFIYEQTDEINTGQFDNAPSDGEVPIFKFQLQSKDDSE